MFFVHLIPAIVILLVWIFIPDYYWLWSGLTILFFGSFLIGLFIQFLYKKLGVAENYYPSKLRSAVGLLETLLFTFFFVIKQPLFIAGYLVIKSIGRHHIDESERSGTSQARRESDSLTIYRLGQILSIILAIIVSVIILIHLKDTRLKVFADLFDY